MATRSTIALEFADGTVQQVYCHWDGYLDHNGKILIQHYKDPFKLRDLIDLGDVSSLGKVIGNQRPFSKFEIDNEDPEREAKLALIEKAEAEGWCNFYGRDRGETGVEAKKFKDFEDYKANHQYEEYEYILRTDGNWYVCKYNGSYELLSAAIEAEAAEREAEEA